MIGTSEIRTYRSLREAGKKLYVRILEVIPKSVLIATARELRLWKKGVLVGEEGDTDVLMERIIYDKRWAGKNTLDHFEGQIGDSALTDDERRRLRVMRTGRFSLFRVECVHRGSHAVLSDCLAEIQAGAPGPPLELVDFGLSETGIAGALLATRLLDAGGFFMTSGVSF
ncbi:MAG: hypothetical protein HYY65_07560, partial [Candidatus Tectomicrobia bacterium]|nr:hypothetical protein [Candidatus Tectomicrobia bacterium]